MKNFLLIALHISVVVFLLIGIVAFVNYLFGINIGIKGSQVPADPLAGSIFLIIAGFCYGISHLFTRRV